MLVFRLERSTALTANFDRHLKHPLFLSFTHRLWSRPTAHSREVVGAQWHRAIAPTRHSPLNLCSTGSVQSDRFTGRGQRSGSESLQTTGLLPPRRPVRGPASRPPPECRHRAGPGGRAVVARPLPAPRRPGPAREAPPAGRAGRRAGILPATRDGDGDRRRGRRRRRARSACPPAGDRPGRPGTPSPATVTGDVGRVTRTLHDAQAVDQLDDDRRGDGDPRLASRAAGYAQAETYTSIREGRACRRQRHADAGGRSHGGRSTAPGASEPRCFVNDQPSAAPDSAAAGRAASFGRYGRARPAGDMPTAKSAVHGHGRPGWTPRASCPWASARTPQAIPGGVRASQRQGGSLRSRSWLGVRRRRERWRGSSPAAGHPGRPAPRPSGIVPPAAARPPRPVGVRPRRPARWRSAAAPGRPAPRPGPIRGINRLFVHYCTYVSGKLHHAVFPGKIAVFPVFRLVPP